MITNMIIKTKQNDGVLSHLKNDNYVNLNTLGYLQHNKNADVYLFNNDISNGIITGNGEDFFYLATHNEDFLNEFWTMLSAGHKCFAGVPRSIADVFQKGKKIAWQNPCKTYALKSEFTYTDNPKYEHDILTVNDAEEVCRNWSDDPGDVSYIRESITLRDSSCIRINGQLSSWCCVHEDNSMGPIHTKEKYRRHGLALIIASRLIEKLLTKNILPYLQIHMDNRASLRLIEKFKGMEYTHECVWFGAEK